MRFKDIEPPKLILEGVKYGAKEHQTVLDRLGEFRIGLEVEMQVPKNDMEDFPIDESIFDGDKLLNTLIRDLGVDPDEFISEFADNLSYEALNKISELVVLENAIDDFYLWVLKNVKHIESYANASDPDRAYQLLKEIVNQQYELSNDPFDAFRDDYLTDLGTALGSTYIISNAFPGAEGVIESLKEFMEELSPYIDDERLREVDDMDDDDLAYITDKGKLRDFAQLLAMSIDHHVDSLSDDLGGIDVYQENLREIYGFYLREFHSRYDLEGIREMFLDDEYTTVEDFIDHVIPISRDQIHHVLDISDDELFYDLDAMIEHVTYHIEEQDYETEFMVVDEHDSQVEIITQGVISGDAIITAWDETWSLVNDLKKYGMNTMSKSGLHISISMPNANTQSLDITKFMVVSNILNLIPTDARNIRRHVSDIRENYTRNLNDLMADTWKAYKKSGNFSQSYLSVLEEWAKKNTSNRGEKYQTVNFGKMDVEDGRIEIRMYGGEGYEDRADDIWQQVVRSMYALLVAHDANFKRKEYLKSLDKMVQGLVEERTGYDVNEFMLRLIKLEKLMGEDYIMEETVDLRVLINIFPKLSDESMRELAREKKQDIQESKMKTLKESSVRLGDVVEVKIGMEDADFYLVRRGTLDAVGRPEKEFNPQSIGLKIKIPDVLDPQYLYYWFMNLHNQGHWKNVAKGTTRLVNITTDDVRNIRFG